MARSVPPPSSPEQAQPQSRARRTGRADPPHQQRAVAALLLAVLSLFGLLGVSNFQRGVYIVGFALVAGALAIWLAATALARTRRAGTAGPRGSVTAIVIGGIGVLLSGVLLLAFALFGKQASTFSRCLSGANTIAAQHACQNQFIHSIKQVTP
jgi:drug/metabolite transporter (DMT)-like permease